MLSFAHVIPLSICPIVPTPGIRSWIHNLCDPQALHKRHTPINSTDRCSRPLIGDLTRMNEQTHTNLTSIIALRDKARPTRLLGMVHVGALPGTPFAKEPICELERQAVIEAKQIEEAGFDAIIVENMHDAPYIHGDRLGPEIVAAMTRITG
ncbi:MAG TPA: hypothetical protein EYO33_33510, partial [Phycisphaerales bacterium]|nr:hypothetical protein [Phycisphaerales bacterium]